MSLRKFLTNLNLYYQPHVQVTLKRYRTRNNRAKYEGKKYSERNKQIYQSIFCLSLKLILLTIQIPFQITLILLFFSFNLTKLCLLEKWNSDCFIPFFARALAPESDCCCSKLLLIRSELRITCNITVFQQLRL